MIFINTLSCVFLTGLIWTIQKVHYPSFAYVAKSDFHSFNVFHQNAITYVVAPLMILELVSALILSLQNPTDYRFHFLLLLVVLIWVSTFVLSVPLHNQLLSGGYDQQVIDKLVSTNWPRTLLWSLRSVILIYIMRSSFVPAS